MRIHFHQMRRLLGMVLVLILLLSFCVTAYAAGEYIHGYFRYRVEDNSVIITAYTGRETVVTVPAMIGGNPVNTIASGAFVNTDVTTIYLPDTIMSVENGAFGVGQTVIYSWDDDNSGGNSGNNDNNNNGDNSGSQLPEGNDQDGTWGGNGNTGAAGNLGNPEPGNWNNAETLPDEDAGFGSEEVGEEELMETNDNTSAETQDNKEPSVPQPQDNKPAEPNVKPSQGSEPAKPDAEPPQDSEPNGSNTEPAQDSEPTEPDTESSQESEPTEPNIEPPQDSEPAEPDTKPEESDHEVSDDESAQENTDAADITPKSETDVLRIVVAIAGCVAVLAAIITIVLRKKYHGR